MYSRPRRSRRRAARFRSIDTFEVDEKVHYEYTFKESGGKVFVVGEVARLNRYNDTLRIAPIAHPAGQAYEDKHVSKVFKGIPEKYYGKPS